jgi:hypothetical protein
MLPVAVRRATAAAVFSCALLFTHIALADPFGWPQPGGPDTAVVLTYSFSNLLDPTFAATLTEPGVRDATTEAFRLWSSYAPLNFIERRDSGPPPSDVDYAPEFHPDIRIGFHGITDGSVLAHAFLPWFTDDSGLAGDIHFNSTGGFTWGLGAGFPAFDFLEVITHEIGHALGLSHIVYADAIMQPYYRDRFRGPGTGYLLAPDILAIRSLYGSGVGSVQPIPEPSTLLLLATGVVAVFVRRARSRCARRPAQVTSRSDDGTSLSLRWCCAMATRTPPAARPPP